MTDRVRFLAYWALVMIGLGVVLAIAEGLAIVGAALAAIWLAVAALARAA